MLKLLEAPSRVAAALRPAPYYTLTEETCDISLELPLLHDASQCLQERGGWDVITMVGDLENVTSIGTVQGRIVDSVGNDTFRLEFNEEGKVTSRKYGKAPSSLETHGHGVLAATWA